MSRLRFFVENTLETLRMIAELGAALRVLALVTLILGVHEMPIVHLMFKASQAPQAFYVN